VVEKTACDDSDKKKDEDFGVCQSGLMERPCVCPVLKEREQKI
jgi:hypothetical protein